MLDPPLTQFTRRPDRLLPYRPFTVVESSPPLTEGVGRGHNYYIEKSLLRHAASECSSYPVRPSVIQTLSEEERPFGYDSSSGKKVVTSALLFSSQ